MKSFKVNKFIEESPNFLGLSFDALKVFGPLAIITVFIGISRMSIWGIIGAAFVISLEYVICNMLIDNKVLKKLSDEEMPNHIKNNL